MCLDNSKGSICLLGSVLVSPAFTGSAAAAECEAPDCWGAIATSDSTHHWGYSYNDPGPVAKGPTKNVSRFEKYQR